MTDVDAPKHTPGPWSVSGCEIIAPGHIVATAHWHSGSDHEQANVRLIAAAPTMYAALADCQRALAMLTDPDAINATTAQVAWAQAHAAEVTARAALLKAGHSQEK